MRKPMLVEGSFIRSVVEGGGRIETKFDTMNRKPQLQTTFTFIKYGQFRGFFHPGNKEAEIAGDDIAL